MKATYIFSSIVFIIAYFVIRKIEDSGVKVGMCRVLRNRHVYLSYFSYIFRHSAATMIWAFWGLILSSLTFFLYALITNVWEMIPVQVLLATSWSFLYVGSLNYITSKNPEKATATGVLNSSIVISAFIGSLLGGVFMSFVFDYKYLMVFSGVVSLIGVMVFKIEERN